MMDGQALAPVRTVGFFTTDRDLVVRSWDAALERMTGISAASARGRRLDEIVPDLDRRGILEIVREPLTSGATQVLAPALHRYLVPCPPVAPSSEFESMQQRVVVTPLRAEGGVVGLAFSVEDVTARLARERRLARELADSDPSVRRAAIDRILSIEPSDAMAPVAGLTDDDWQVRRRAVSSVAAKADAAIVRSLVAALRDGHRDFNLLSSAIKLLALTGVDATAALIELLSDGDADVRIQGALALGTQRRPEAVAALIAALDDADVNVRFHAVEALGKLGATAAVERLAAMLASRDFFLSFAILDALVRIGDASAVPDILPLLADPALAAAAAEALGHLGDEEAVPALAAALDRPESPVTAIVDTLAAIHARYEQTSGAAGHIEDLVRRAVRPSGAGRLLAEVRHARGGQLRNLVVVLGWLRGGATERALADLLGNASVNHEVIEALVRFGSPMVDLLVAQLDRDDIDSRRAAVAALGRIGDRRAVPALIRVIESDDRPLLVNAAGALARLGDGRAFEPLLRLIADDDVAVRHAAVGALNSIGHPGMPDRVDPLLDSTDRNVREAAVRIAGYFGYASCADRLLACAADDDESVRAAALEHLAYLDDPRAADVLARAAVADTPRARAAAARALGFVDGPAASGALAAALGDADAWVRYFAATSLGRRRDAAAFAGLAALARTDPARQVRVAAIEAIGAIGGSEAADLLASVADTADDDIAATALRSIGTATDGATAVLQGALRSPVPRRRAAAAQALAASCSPEAIEALQWTASADDAPEVWRAAIAGLASAAARRGPFAETAALALLGVALDAGRSADAIDAIVRLPAWAIPAIGGALTQADVRIRRLAVDALARVARPEASRYLVQALDDRDPTVRQRAVGALARLGTRGVGRRLAAIAHRDESPLVRRTAEAALARTGDA